MIIDEACPTHDMIWFLEKGLSRPRKRAGAGSILFRSRLVLLATQSIVGAKEGRVLQLPDILGPRSSSRGRRRPSSSSYSQTNKKKSQLESSSACRCSTSAVCLGIRGLGVAGYAVARELLNNQRSY